MSFNIIIQRITSNSVEFKLLTHQLDNELKQLYGDSQEAFDQFNIVADVETVVVAYINNMPAGCGCFKMFDSNTVELKRMFVGPQCRGKGVGAAILMELEQWAKELNYSTIILETGTIQVDAIQLYKKHNYQIIPNFAPYIGNELSICFAKRLD